MKAELFLVHLLILVSLSSAPVKATDDSWVKKVQYRSDYMIKTRSGNYAIKSPDFRQKNWATFHANGYDCIATSPDCKESVYSLVNGQKSIWVIDDVKSTLDQQSSSEVCGIPLTKGKQKKLEIISYNEDGSIENILSLNMDHADDEIAIVGETSIFFQEGALTTVYRDGKIQMRPANCLTDEENGLLEKLRRANSSYKKIINESEQMINSIVEEFMNKLTSTRSVE